MPLLFNDLFVDQDFGKSTLLMRHRPLEPSLRRDLPLLAANAPEIYNAYQQTQSPREEAQLARASHLASFIGHEPGKALFIGLYKKSGQRAMTFDEYWCHPSYRYLKPYGIRGLSKERGTCQWFDLVEQPDFYGQWKGKLIIEWPGGGKSWSRWLTDKDYPIHAVLEESLLDPPLSHWSAISLSYAELGLISQRMRNALTHWRGIYFIFDEGSGRGYVGSASGSENLLGRWSTYADNGHGGNRSLRGLDPTRFRFSILELVSPAMPPEDVVALETSWKVRLNTREPFGLNMN